MSPPNSNVAAYFQTGLQALQTGNLTKAEASFNAVLAVDARHLGALCLMSEVFSQSNNLTNAIKFLKSALAVNPNVPDIHNNLGLLLNRNGQRQEAVKAFQHAISLKPDFFQGHNNLGTTLRSLGQFADSLTRFDAAIQINSKYFEAHLNRGNCLRNLGRFNEALKALDTASQLQPENPLVYLNRGLLLRAMKRLPEALVEYDKAIALRPNFAEAHLNKGVALQESKMTPMALEAYTQAIKYNPEMAEAHYNRGNTLLKQAKIAEALADFDAALNLKTNYIEAMNGRGECLNARGKYVKALTLFDRIIAIKPDFAEVQAGRAQAFNGLGRYRDALAAANRYISLRPNSAEGYVLRGDCFYSINQLGSAEEDYDRAITLEATLPQAFAGRARARSQLGQHASALADFQKTLELDPEFEGLQSAILASRMAVCDWKGIDFSAANISAIMRQNPAQMGALRILSLSHSSRLNYDLTKLIANQTHPPSSRALPKRATKRAKIHIGYFSADFREHATAYLMAEMFELHDRSRFEISAFAFGPDDQSPLRARLAKSFDRFIDVDKLPDIDVASMVRKLNVDIAIDLKGYTQFERSGIFAQRAAPIQVNYLGYPGSMCADYFDYILADPTVIPIDDQQFFSEKVAYLPNSYLMNDRKREFSGLKMSRKSLQLPETAFVFCSFNANHKITPDVFETWMRILKRVNDSVLWLLEGSAIVVANLRREAQRHGVNPDRLVFAPKMPVGQHMARQATADLFLDTLPYNAHTTAIDALWGGLPVLTRLGKTFAGRVAASLLTSIGMPELITQSEEEYENLAVAIALNPTKAAQLKKKLNENRNSTPLFNTVQTTRDIEAAFEQMVEIHDSGQSARSFYVMPQK